MLFAEEEEEVLRAAIAGKDGGYGIPVLVGANETGATLAKLGVEDSDAYELHNARHPPLVPQMVERLYDWSKRKSFMRRDHERMVNRDRKFFGALMLAMGKADMTVTGVTRPFRQTPFGAPGSRSACQHAYATISSSGHRPVPNSPHACARPHCAPEGGAPAGLQALPSIRRSSSNCRSAARKGVSC